MIKLFIGTANLGKQKEIQDFANRYGHKNFQLLFPDDNTRLDVPETGTTYQANALLKATAYYDSINDGSLIYVGDDSGIIIPSLGNEPGVLSKRWAGFEMSDEQILSYCLHKMTGLTKDSRRAVFETVIVALKKPGEYATYTGDMSGHILDEPQYDVSLNGFPFRSTFWVDEVNRVWDDAVALNTESRQGFLTNREKAFKKLFEEMK
ncbi:MAG: non-canonical purine NTP pyrophosphatase [Candidatus Saccharibacteria bacterium]